MRGCLWRAKFKAVNNGDRNFTKAKIASNLARLKAEVGRYIAEADKIDRQEIGEVRAMATGAQHSGHVGHNVQSVVDAETHLIVTHDVTNQGHDLYLLTAMATKAKAVLKRETLHILADKGSFSYREILRCHAADFTAAVPRPDTSGSRSEGSYLKADFAYAAEADVYRCPSGEVLTYRCTTKEDGIQLRRSWTTACQGCDMKSRCTTGRERRITRREHEHLIEAADAPRRSTLAPMMVRRSTVELPFCTLKA